MASHKNRTRANGDCLKMQDDERFSREKNEDPSGGGKTPDDLFNAYILKINIIGSNRSTDPSTDPSKIADALSTADDVIAKAQLRRFEEQRKEEIQDAIAQTDLDAAELAAKKTQSLNYAKNIRSTIPSSTKKGPTRPLVNEIGGMEDISDLPCGTPADNLRSANKVGAPSVSYSTQSGVSSGKSSHIMGLPNMNFRRRAPKDKRHTLLAILFGLVFALLIALCVWLIIKYTPTSKRMSYKDYFGDMAENEAAIVLQDHILNERALCLNNTLYLPYDLVRGTLNERFFWDNTLSDMLFTTATQTFEIPINSTSYSVIDGALTSDPTREASYNNVILFRDDNGDLFLNLDFIAQYTNITYSFEKDTQHVLLRYIWGDTLTASADKDAAVRFDADIKSPILTDLDKGDPVIVLEQNEKWTSILTQDGYIGYAKTNRLSVPVTTDMQNEGFVAQEYPSLASEERISLVWQMIQTKDGNQNLEKAIADMEGVSVISPTWFSLSDNEGNIDSIGTKSYVKTAHKNDLLVWGLVDDFSSSMDTSVMLASTTARRNCIGQLVSYAENLDLDGINLDFEYVESADALFFTQFIREMSIACRLSGLVFSIDTFAPYDFNAYYNRLEFATVADYIINMGYDEHYAGIEEAGSVASLSYEEDAINNLLAMGIPSSKIISAVPFYTRIWYTATGSDGVIHVNSEEISMGSVVSTLESWNVTAVWDESTAQYYASWYTDDGVLCEIWIEDASSLQRKILLIPKYSLGGTAIWALGFQDDSIWSTISDTLDLTEEEAISLEQNLIIEKEREKAETNKALTADSETEAETIITS